MALNALNNAISGFKSASQQVNKSAINIVSADATNVAPASPAQVTIPVAQLQLANKNGNDTDANSAASTLEAASSDDVPQELVNTNIATYNAKANLVVIKEQKRTIGDLLNIVS